jgi:hypothetical protein
VPRPQPLDFGILALYKLHVALELALVGLDVLLEAGAQRG